MTEETKNILGSVTISKKVIDEINAEVKDISGLKKKIEQYLAESVTDLLDVILYGAISLNVSDIHIEPQDEETRLRVRLDGVLQDVIFFTHTVYHHVLLIHTLFGCLR